MRLFVLLLILINAVFLLVTQREEKETVHQIPELPAGVPSIVMLDELPPATTPTETEVVPAPAPPSCFTTGPFDSRDKAEALLAALRDAGADPATLREVVVVAQPVAWWVHLPPFPTRRDAEEAATALSSKGFHDLFIVKEGDQANALSLGVFTAYENAVARRSEIERFGQDAIISVRGEASAEFFVDYGIVPAGDATVEPVQMEDAVVHRIVIECRSLLTEGSIADGLEIQ